MQEALEQAGLTQTEARVYIALVELGESKTGDILKHAKLNSGRIYQVLASLQDKGLVSTVTKKSVQLFVPAPPDRILDHLNDLQSQIEEQKQEFEKSLSDLNKLYDAVKQDTLVETFIGAQGQRSAYEILFKEATKSKQLFVYGVVGKKKYPKAILDTLRFYVYKQRTGLKLRTKKLMAEEARGEKFFTQDNAKIRYLPFPTMTSTQILGDVTMITYENNPIITVLIHNEEIAQDHKRQFNHVWKHAKD